MFVVLVVHANNKLFICPCILSLEPLTSNHRLAIAMSTPNTAKKPAKKRGNPGDFLGKRGEFLESYRELYAEHSRNKTTQEFWRNLFPAYWSKFHWRLPINQEPPEPPEPVLLNGVVVEPPPQPAEVLTPEEDAEKKATMFLVEKVRLLLIFSICLGVILPMSSRFRRVTTRSLLSLFFFF